MIDGSAHGRVDEALDGFIAMNVLDAALRLGVLDALRSPTPPPALAQRLQVDPRELDLVLDVLVQRGWLEGEGELKLSPDGERLLASRDLLEARIDYAKRVSAAMLEFYTASIQEPGRFLGKLIDFFHFDPSESYSDETARNTAAWVRYMSTLTRYHAPHLLEALDLTGVSRLLDVGGNNGECAMHLCHHHPTLRVTVADIPVVCDLGERHVGGSGVEDRIRFSKTDLRHASLPTGFDAILFKSVLHDWPDAGARSLLEKARAALSPGGKLFVFEFRAYDLRREALTFKDIVNVPFLSHLRRSDRYERWIDELGMRVTGTRTVDAIHFLSVEAER